MADLLLFVVVQETHSDGYGLVVKMGEWAVECDDGSLGKRAGTKGFIPFECSGSYL